VCDLCTYCFIVFCVYIRLLVLQKLDYCIVLCNVVVCKSVIEPEKKFVNFCNACVQVVNVF